MILVILAFLVGSTIVSMLTIKLATKLIEVGRDSWGACGSAALLSAILGMLPYLLGFSYAWIASILISIWIFKKLLETGIAHALGVYVISVVANILLFVLLSLLFAGGVMMQFSKSGFGDFPNFGSFDMQTPTPSEDLPAPVRNYVLAADDVCRCGTDQGCLEQKGRQFQAVTRSLQGQEQLLQQHQQLVGQYMALSLQCAMSPRPYQAPPGIDALRNPVDIRASIARSREIAVESGLQAPEPGETVAVAKPAPEKQPARPKIRYGYRDLPPDGLRSSDLGSKVRVDVLGGRQRNGRLHAIHDERISVESEQGRGLLYEVNLDQIVKLQVWGPLPGRD